MFALWFRACRAALVLGRWGFLLEIFDVGAGIFDVGAGVSKSLEPLVTTRPEIRCQGLGFRDTRELPKIGGPNT